jgi:hypothetical protein
MAKFTLHINPYKVHKKCSNAHGCYFLKCHYCNVWLINVHPPMNVHKPLGQNLHQKMLMPFFNFEVLKRKPTKSIWIMPQVKFSKNIVLGGKFWKNKIVIEIHMDLWKYGPILTIQKFETIIWLRSIRKGLLIWIYHFILQHILSH